MIPSVSSIIYLMKPFIVQIIPKGTKYLTCSILFTYFQVSLCLYLRTIITCVGLHICFCNLFMFFRYFWIGICSQARYTKTECWNATTTQGVHLSRRAHRPGAVHGTEGPATGSPALSGCDARSYT